MNEQENRNLAKWARDYLAMQTPLNELIQMASIGDDIAKAALKILSSVEWGIINGKYCNISINRAATILSNGLHPPYCIKCKENENEISVISQYDVNERFENQYSIIQKIPNADILTEFMFE